MMFFSAEHRPHITIDLVLFLDSGESRTFTLDFDRQNMVYKGNQSFREAHAFKSLLFI
jgi:hypothetical protein